MVRARWVFISRHFHLFRYLSAYSNISIGCKLKFRQRPHFVSNAENGTPCVLRNNEIEVMKPSSKKYFLSTGKTLFIGCDKLVFSVKCWSYSKSKSWYAVKLWNISREILGVNFSKSLVPGVHSTIYCSYIIKYCSIKMRFAVVINNADLNFKTSLLQYLLYI